MHTHQSRCIKVFFICIFRIKLLIRIIILIITIVLCDVKFTRKSVWERSGHKLETGYTNCSINFLFLQLIQLSVFTIVKSDPMNFNPGCYDHHFIINIQGVRTRWGSTKPSGKLRRHTPSFGCILAVWPKKYFF